jgi:carboxyvinyl-carboxyphosphonate phosphorylmutase
VVGRTSAAAITGTADAIARAKAYQDTGVDALFFAGRMTRDQLDAIAAEVKLPIVLGGVSGDMLDKAYLASRGVRIALLGHQPFSAAVQAVYATLKALRDGAKPSELTGIASGEMMARVTRDGDYKSWTERFLGG